MGVSYLGFPVHRVVRVRVRVRAHVRGTESSPKQNDFALEEVAVPQAPDYVKRERSTEQCE